MGLCSLFFYENTCCDPSLEPSRQDGSNEGSQHVSLRYKKNYLWSSVLQMEGVTPVVLG